MKIDIWDTYRSAVAAAERLGEAAAVKERIRKLILAEGKGPRFAKEVLGRELGVL